MPMHFFHCTDGVDLIVDRTGRAVPSWHDVADLAREVAAELMRALPAYDEWADWAVHVYDRTGQVDVVPFRERGGF